MKNSLKHGKRTSDCEVLGVSPFGVWLLFQGKEYFLNHREFPWFMKSTIEAVMNVETLSSEHLYWPDLDVDLHVDSLEHPENYPLISRKADNKRLVRTRKARRTA